MLQIEVDNIIVSKLVVSNFGEGFFNNIKLRVSEFMKH